MRLSVRLAVLAAPLAATLAATLGAQDASVARDTALRRTIVTTDFSYVSWGGDIAAWRLGSIALSRRTAAGSVIARVNVADRFGATGAQVEVDAYPRLRTGTYLYLNAGYSASSVFPEWRSGGELFQSLPQAWEASAGYRQLRFGGTPVTLFTGSVGKYAGDYWISLRPYLRFKDSGTSASAGLTVRRYGADGDHYIGATISAGSSPTDRVAPEQLARTNSVGGGVQGSSSVARHVLGTWSIGTARETLESGRARTSWTVMGGLAFEF